MSAPDVVLISGYNHSPPRQVVYFTLEDFKAQYLFIDIAAQVGGTLVLVEISADLCEVFGMFEL